MIKAINLLKLIMIGFITIAHLFNDLDDIDFYIVLILFFILNMQLRKFYKKEFLYILSFVIELVIIYLLGSNFSHFSFILITITITESIYYIKTYILGILLTEGIIFIICLFNLVTFNQALIYLFIYCITLVFAWFFYQQNKELNQIQFLYDDVRRYSYELESAKLLIEKFSKQVENLAQIKERNRIAETLHDTVGHRLTSLLMQMEAGTLLIDKEPHKAKALIDDSKDKLRESIEMLRDTVKNMEVKQYKNFHSYINEILIQYKKDFHIETSLIIKGTPITIHPEKEMVLVKNIEEALNNTIKHSNANNIFIEIEYNHENLQVHVRDDGTVEIEGIIKGFGMNTMEKRIKFIGGHMSINYSNGFLVSFVVPILGG